MSGNIAILRHITTDAGTLSGGSWETTLPRSNIRTQDVMEVARSTDATTASTQIRIDFGTSLARYIGLLLILGHNFSTSGQVRFVLTNSATDATARIYDSGLINAWQSVQVYAAAAGGTYGSDGASYPDGYVSDPVVRHKLSSVQTVGSGGARYLFVYVEDTGNAAGYVEIGRLLGGPAWQPGINAEFGLSLRVVDSSEVLRTRGGLRVAGSDRVYREARLRLGWLTQAEAFGFLYEWKRLGLSREVWFEADYEADADMGNRRAMYAALAEMPALAETNLDFYSCDIVLQELT